MRVRSAVLSSLAMLPLLGGCKSTYGCDPEHEAYELDQAVSAATIEEILRGGPPSTERTPKVECAMVCGHVYHQTRRWDAATFDRCSLTRPEAGQTEGWISCAGTGVEYMCEGRRPLGPRQCDQWDGAGSPGAAEGRPEGPAARDQ